MHIYIYLYKKIGFSFVRPISYWLKKFRSFHPSVRPSDILLAAKTQGNGYQSVSGVSLNVMGIT